MDRSDTRKIASIAPAGSPAWNHFRAFVDQLVDGVTIQTLDGKLVYANELGARVSGYASADELVAAPTGDYVRLFEVMDITGRALSIDDLPGRQAIRDGSGHAVLRVRHRESGQERWTDVRSFLIREPGGTPSLVANIIRDVTHSIEALRAAEHSREVETEARERAEFLARATALFGQSLDYKQTLNHVASLLVPTIADWCAIDLLDHKTGGLRRLAVAHADPAKTQWGWDLYRRFPPDMTASTGVPNVLRTGEPELYRLITDDMLVQAARSAEELSLIREIGLRSAMIIPLRAGDRTEGAISLIATESRREFSDDDLAFATELGRRAGAAIERAELYAAATEHAQWLSRLQQITVGLSRSVTLDDAIDTATNLGRQLFDADAAGLWLLSKDRTYLELGGAFAATEAVFRDVQSLSVESWLPTTAAFVHGEPIVLENPMEIAQQFPSMADVVGAHGIGAIASGPVKVAGEVIGVLSFRYAGPREFSPDYVTALRTFLKELGQAIDRTRMGFPRFCRHGVYAAVVSSLMLSCCSSKAAGLK